MIIILSTECTQEQKEAIEDYIRSCNGRVVEAPGETRNVLGVIGTEHTVDRDVVSGYPGVARIVPITQPYKLAGKDLHKEDTQIAVNGTNGVQLTLGCGAVGVIAGPCTVESRDQIVEAAHAVKEAGATALRGGAYKPRTSPYSFQGLKEKGLEYLAEARKETGLPIVTEALGVDHLDHVAEVADVVQIGARNMQNFPLLTAAGRQPKPVLLKRGLACTLDEFLLAAEYIMVEGNHNVILCERGIRTFEGEVRFTLALAAIPLLREKTHLPIIVDPSHGTGRAALVGPMSRAAIAAGADGLLIEVHPNPKVARIDGAQSVTCTEFSDIMEKVTAISRCMGRSGL